jgi:60 kDa SS-A/Ro ribonucleoprotein
MNAEGGVAFKPTAKNDLTLRVLTWLVGEPKFYGNKGEMQEIQNLVASIAQEDPEFILQLAAYARTEMYLRSAPTFLLVEAAMQEKCRKYIKKYAPAILARADELTEVIAQFIARNGQIGTGGKAVMPNALDKGIIEALHNFDEFQLRKYQRSDKKVKLRDVLRLTHPKPRNPEESALYKRILKGELAPIDTWETTLSANDGKSKKEKWESIIPKMGYMALLRNLMNMLGAEVNMEAIDYVCKKLTDPQGVRYSKQFPYRFLSAYKMLENPENTVPNQFARQKFMEAVTEALELSVANIPAFEGLTFVATDNSGSMSSPLSEKSKIKRVEVGNIMGALAQRISKFGVASVFGTYFQVVPLNSRDSVMSNAQKLIGTNVDHSTNAYLVLQHLIEKKLKVDRIMLFSDMQCYDSSNLDLGYPYFGRSAQTSYGNTLAAMLKTYKRTVNPDVYMYSFDLSGYGTLQFPEDEPRVCLLAGFSDRVFDFIKAYEQFGKGMVDIIKEHSVVYEPIEGVASKAEEDEGSG